MKAVTAGAMAATIGIATGAAASATAAPVATGQAVRGAEHFSIITTSSNIPVDESFIATGALTAAGRDDAGAKMDRITVPGGGFILHHSGRAKTSFNTGTCLLAEKGTGCYTLAGGRGTYEGITGAGKYVLTVRAVFPSTPRAPVR